MCRGGAGVELGSGGSAACNTCLKCELSLSVFRQCVMTHHQEGGHV